MTIKKKNFIILFFLFNSYQSVASDKLIDDTFLTLSIEKFIASETNYKYYGFATYLNTVSYLIIDEKKIYKIKATDRVTLKKTQWLVVASRYNVFLINQNGLILNRGNGKLTFDPLSINPNTIKIFNKLKKKDVSNISHSLEKVYYHHLWVPFSFLAICFENILKTIYFIGIENWGLVVIIFSLFLKILLFPVFLFTLRQQISVRKVKKIITPKLLHIKKKYKGEEAHNLYIRLIRI